MRIKGVCRANSDGFGNPGAPGTQSLPVSLLAVVQPSSAIRRNWRNRFRWSYLVPVSSGLSLWYQARRHWTSFPDLLRVNAEEPAGEGISIKARRSTPAPGTILKAVNLGTKWPPFESTCLVRSLVLAGLLRHYGYPARVVIGVQSQGLRDPSDRWFAHAWVDMGASTTVAGYDHLVRLDLSRNASGRRKH